MYFITACKRSLGQGNILINVCQGFCPKGGGGAWSKGRGAWSGGCLVPGDAWSQGGAWSWGVPGPRGTGSRPERYLVPGGCGDPPRWLLLRAVRILLECILVCSKLGQMSFQKECVLFLDYGLRD